MLIKKKIKQHHSAKNAKSPFVLSWCIAGSGIFRCCSKHGKANARWWGIQGWKPCKGFLAVRDCSQFPQKLESQRNGPCTADMRTSLRLQNIPAGFQETFYHREPASTAHRGLHRGITKASLASSHLPGALSLKQDERRVHIPAGAGKFSASTRESNTPGDDNGCCNLLPCRFPSIKLKLFC